MFTTLIGLQPNDEIIFVRAGMISLALSSLLSQLRARCRQPRSNMSRTILY